MSEGGRRTKLFCPDVEPKFRFARGRGRRELRQLTAKRAR